MKINYFAALTFFNFALLQSSEQLNQDLMKAARDGQLETVRYLVEQRADVNAKTKDELTALMGAASKGHTDIVKYLAERGANINAKDKDEYNALWHAFNKGHTETVTFLREHYEANINAKRKTSKCAATDIDEQIEITTEEEMLEAREYAKKHDIFTFSPLSVEQDLIKAASQGQPERVGYFIKCGASAYTRDDDGMTLLMHAARNGHTETMRYLIEITCIDTPFDIEPLSEAFLSVTQRIIKSRRRQSWKACIALQDKRDDNGMTALMHAARNGHTETVGYITELKTDINRHFNALTYKHLNNLLTYKDEDLNNLLTYKDEDLDNLLTNKDLDIEAPIRLIRLIKDPRALMEFKSELELNPNINSNNKALMYAAYNGHTKTVRYLAEEHGADVNAKNNDGWTVLMFVAHKGYTDIVKYLVEQRADINAKSNTGCTALMLAADQGHTEIVEYLVDHGAKHNNVCTALTIAKERNPIGDIARYLKKSVLHRYLKGSLARCLLAQEPNLAHYVTMQSKNNELSTEQQLDNAREAFEIDQDLYWRALLQDVYFHWQEKEQPQPITRLLTEIDSGRLLQIIGYFNNRIAFKNCIKSLLPHATGKQKERLNKILQAERSVKFERYKDFDTKPMIQEK